MSKSGENPTTLHVKNMVCDRCIRVIKEEFSALGLEMSSIELGKIVLARAPTPVELDSIRTRLLKNGFALAEDKKVQAVERIKTLIIELIQKDKLEELDANISVYLAKELGKEYGYLSQLFSTIENYTIEKFFILQKIERVKEWLVYNDFTLSEIAYKLRYSSTAHISNQFKQITGMTPSEFKALKSHPRKPLDRVHSE